MRLLSWFRGKPDRDAEERRLHERLSGLERAVEQLHDKPSGHNITIHNLHVHNPALEQLLFRLDRLDIDELSGALNLGNNFGTRVGKPDQSGKPKGKPSGKPEGPESQGGLAEDVQKTPAGFKLNLGAKPDREKGRAYG